MLKKADLVFLAHLRNNARQTLTKISRRTKIPISTLYDKLKTHEKNLVFKHTTLIDFTKLGYNSRAKIILAVNKAQRNDLKSFLLQYPSINSLFKINNGYDFLVEGIFENVKDLEDFLELLDEKFELSEKKVFHIIEDIKREEFLAKPENLPEISF